MFSSGRRCQTFDELALACQDEWAPARELLRRGTFRRFLERGGRLDLARAALEAEAHMDTDVALQTFVSSLPLTVSQDPRLDLKPRRLQLGSLRAGEVRQVQLTVSNIGRGLLHGTLALDERCGWLRLDEADDSGVGTIKTRRQQVVTLQVNAHGLPAAQTYNTRLTLITNGGIVEVPVRLELAAFAFPKPPLERAGSPRELAQRMRAVPRRGAAAGERRGGPVVRHQRLDLSGAGTNGARRRRRAAIFRGPGPGSAAARAAGGTMRFTCQLPKVATGQVVVLTEVRKWIYARADSDVPWIRLRKASASGPQRATLAFEIDSSLLDAGRVHDGTVTVVANGGQTLACRVRVEGAPAGRAVHAAAAAAVPARRDVAAAGRAGAARRLRVVAVPVARAGARSDAAGTGVSAGTSGGEPENSGGAAREKRREKKWAAGCCQRRLCMLEMRSAQIPMSVCQSLRMRSTFLTVSSPWLQ